MGQDTLLCGESLILRHQFRLHEPSRLYLVHQQQPLLIAQFNEFLTSSVWERNVDFILIGLVA